MDCAMARYAIHTLSFDESSVFQKRWALYAASLFLQRIRYRLIETRGLRVDFLKRETPASLIGITLLPGRRDRQRELEQDLLQLQKQRIGSVLCLLSDNEFELYGVPDLLKRYAGSGFTVMHAPVVDQAIPSFEEMDAMLAFVDSSLAEQRRILVHCAGGLGRSGTVAACYLTTRDGLSVDEAIDVVRESRSPRMVENRRQEDFVRQYTERSAR
jgi:protein-tyrosine phosphatase